MCECWLLLLHTQTHERTRAHTRARTFTRHWLAGWARRWSPEKLSAILTHPFFLPVFFVFVCVSNSTLSPLTLGRFIQSGHAVENTHHICHNIFYLGRPLSLSLSPFSVWKDEFVRGNASFSAGAQRIRTCSFVIFHPRVFSYSNYVCVCVWLRVCVFI